MARLRLSLAAETDIVDILACSQSRFGEAARRRYEQLIVVALSDIASDPLRPGSTARPELGAGVRSWHLRGSRLRVAASGTVVARPRHFIIYRQTDPDLVAVSRLLHDAMELRRHLQTPDIWE